MQRFSRSIPSLAAATVAALLLASCGTDDAGSADPGSVSVEQLQGKVDPAAAAEVIEAGNHTVIDVRTPAEFAEGHVDGAENIDVQSPDFADRIAELDPDGAYVVYCRSGNRSAAAYQAMQDAGFTSVVDAGGFDALVGAGVATS
ncbi:rhodanese-like domain-containing protein [Georgenia sp. M64]|uniref:rhodanese-like domain-containing protein n=1 Tax=Georgenia sp. M64 TaxID=3120520 RepID=UPI0030E2024C